MAESFDIVEVGVPGPPGTGVGTHTAESTTLTHVRVVTSTTRPTSPIEGQVIYETDTDKYLQWTGAAWQDLGINLRKPAAKAYRATSVISIADNTETVLNLNAESYDTDTMHDVSTNSSRIVVPAGWGGRVRVTGNIAFAADADGWRQAAIRKNAAGVAGGGTLIGRTRVAAPAVAASVFVPVHAEFVAVAGDYVELFAHHTAGGAINVDFGEAETWLHLSWEART